MFEVGAALTEGKSCEQCSYKGERTHAVGSSGGYVGSPVPDLKVRLALGLPPASAHPIGGIANHCVQDLHAQQRRACPQSTLIISES